VKFPVIKLFSIGYDANVCFLNRTNQMKKMNTGDRRIRKFIYI